MDLDPRQGRIEGCRAQVIDADLGGSDKSNLALERILRKTFGYDIGCGNRGKRAGPAVIVEHHGAVLAGRDPHLTDLQRIHPPLFHVQHHFRTEIVA